MKPIINSKPKVKSLKIAICKYLQYTHYKWGIVRLQASEKGDFCFTVEKSGIVREIPSSKELIFEEGIFNAWNFMRSITGICLEAKTCNIIENRIFGD